MPVAHGQQGISWLELYILFGLHGGALDVRSQLTTKAACTRISTLRALGTFKLWAKRVITQCGDTNVHNLYKACKVSQLWLEPPGFTTFVSCFCFLPVLLEEHAFHLIQPCSILGARLREIPCAISEMGCIRYCHANESLGPLRPGGTCN